LGFIGYIFKIRKTSVEFNFSPAIAFNFGLIPFALCYAFLGLVNHLELLSFIVGMLIFGIIGCSIFGFRLLAGTLNPKIYIPDLLSVFKILILLPSLIYGFGFALLPTSNWDSISYVLTFPKTYNAEGGIRYLSEGEW